MSLSMYVNFTSLLPPTPARAQSTSAYALPSSQGPKTPTGLISHNAHPSPWDHHVHNNRKRPRSEDSYAHEDSRQSKRAKAEVPAVQAAAPSYSLYEASAPQRNDTQQTPRSFTCANKFFDDDPWQADLAPPNGRQMLPQAVYEGADAWTGEAVEDSGSEGEPVYFDESAFEYASSSYAGDISFAEGLDPYNSTSSVEYFDFDEIAPEPYAPIRIVTKVDIMRRRDYTQTSTAPAPPRTLADRQRLKRDYRPKKPSPLRKEVLPDIDLSAWFTISGQDEFDIFESVARSLGERV